MLPLLNLLASREGTAQAVQDLLYEDRSSVQEIQPKTKEGPLHVLLRRCVLPLELYGLCKVLVDHKVDVNWRDYRGATPLSLLILHINHGLRYHSYPLPQIQRLDDLGAPRQEIQKTVAAIDTEYQQQVYWSLELLLSAGAEVNAVPGIVPAIPSHTAWVEAYEHKLMQQEGRWNLLGFETSMEVSTYNIFNPVSSHRCINELSITPLHLASWRGDARCIRLLLDHGADATAIAHNPHHKQTTITSSIQQRGGGDDVGRRWVTSAGRGALHFLYMYCNKPGDLVTATRHLLEAGANTDLLHQGEAPCHLLVPHVFVKRTYHQYLSSCYVMDELQRDAPHDDYINEIEVCLGLLQGGAVQRTLQDTLVLETAKQFGGILFNTDKDFQQRGHYLVPYTYRMQPLMRFFQVLMSIGAKVNFCDKEGQTPLHHLVASLTNLCLHPGLNPISDVIDCFSVLLEGGADPNKTDMMGRSAVNLLHRVIMTLLSFQPRREEEGEEGSGSTCCIGLLELLVQHGGDLNLADCGGKLPLPSTLGTFLKALWDRTNRASLYPRYMEFLVMQGASFEDLSIGDHLQTAVFLHHQSHPSPDNHRPASLLLLSPILLTLCACLPQPLLSKHLHQSLNLIDPSQDFRRSLMEEELVANCDMCSVLRECAASPGSLKSVCRRTIRESVRGRYGRNVRELPLPQPIIQYLLDLTHL